MNQANFWMSEDYRRLQKCGKKKVCEKQYRQELNILYLKPYISYESSLKGVLLPPLPPNENKNIDIFHQSSWTDPTKGIFWSIKEPHLVNCAPP